MTARIIPLVVTRAAAREWTFDVDFQIRERSNVFAMSDDCARKPILYWQLSNRTASAFQTAVERFTNRKEGFTACPPFQLVLKGWRARKDSNL